MSTLLALTLQAPRTVWGVHNAISDAWASQTFVAGETREKIKQDGTYDTAFKNLLNVVSNRDK